MLYNKDKEKVIMGDLSDIGYLVLGSRSAAKFEKVPGTSRRQEHRWWWRWWCAPHKTLMVPQCPQICHKVSQFFVSALLLSFVCDKFAGVRSLNLIYVSGPSSLL